MNTEKDIKKIIRRYLNGESNHQELDDAISILSEPYNNLKLSPTLFEHWTNNENKSVKALEKEELGSMLDQIHLRINNAKEKNIKLGTKGLIITISKIAAILVVGFLFGVLINNISFQEPVYYTSVAPMGSISQMMLPDNSIVYLNSGSEIKYSIDGVQGKREVFLKGEAWFQVEKNKKKPFIVHTPYYNINVLGTEFNVKAYPDDNEIVTTLEKGSIQITSAENFQLENNQLLEPGEQLIYNKQNKTIQLEMVKTKRYTAWKENKLIFINMSLKELITLLERKYGVDIEVMDETILNYHYDGTLKNETILEILEILQKTLPISYDIVGQKVEINAN